MIPREQVLHVARLARLGLDEEEVERLQAELSAILDAVGKISELDLGDIEPTAHPLDVANVLGEDEPAPPLPRDLALSNAPDAEDGFYGVPAV